MIIMKAKNLRDRRVLLVMMMMMLSMSFAMLATILLDRPSPVFSFPTPSLLSQRLVPSQSSPYSSYSYSSALRLSTDDEVQQLLARARALREEAAVMSGKTIEEMEQEVQHEKKLALERQSAIDKARKENFLAILTIALNEELEFQVQDMQNSLEAKKQVEYYSNIIGMALPGLAKFFTNSPVGSAFNFLAGTDQEKSMEQSSDGTKDTQRETILEMITTFVQTLDNQELGTIYLMLSEIEKDRSNIQKILQFITGSTTVETPIQTH